jgi:hypothetical protein
MHRTTNMGDIHSFYKLELEVEKAVDKHFLYKEIEHATYSTYFWNFQGS